MFDSTKVAERHQQWLEQVRQGIGLGNLPVVPYWEFNDLYVKVGTKLTNCFFVGADVKKANGKEYFFYNSVLMLKKVNLKSLSRVWRKG